MNCLQARKGENRVFQYRPEQLIQQNPDNGSVISKRAHSPTLGICRAFVILFQKSCKCPTVGLKNRVQMPHPGTTPKLYFPVNKLQIPCLLACVAGVERGRGQATCLWEISNDLTKTREAPYANRPLPLVIIIAKKDHIHLININGRTIIQNFNNTFLTFEDMFNIVNDKQTTDELNMSIFSSRWNCFVSVLIVALIVQYQKFILGFKYLAKFFQAFLPQPFTHKGSVFLLTLQTVLFFPPSAK